MPVLNSAARKCGAQGGARKVTVLWDYQDQYRTLTLTPDGERHTLRLELDEGRVTGDTDYSNNVYEVNRTSHIPRRVAKECFKGPTVSNGSWLERWGPTFLVAWFKAGTGGQTAAG